MNNTKKRGFGGLDPERQRQIASMGGKAAHKLGVAHKFTSDEAKIAGKKGGRSVSANRDHMVTIGRKGGVASHAKRESRIS